MPPPKPPTSTSTENLLLKCQKETRKKCLPPEWSIHPPNQEIHPPQDTLALAIQIDASSPASVHFHETSSNRLVGSIGPEYRGSIVVVPWRPGLKFVCLPTCRRRSGCRVGVVREASGKGAAKTKIIGATTILATSSSSAGGNKNIDTGADNAPQAVAATIASPTSSSGYSRSSRRTTGDKSHASSKHVSFDDKSISGKSSIATDGGGPFKPRTKIDVKPRQRC